MFFALICTDKPDALALRLKTRPEHLAHLRRLDANGKLKAAGPTLDADGKPNGSLIVIAGDDRQEIEDIAAADPYSKAGLFASVEIRPFDWVFKNPDKSRNGNE